MNRVISRMQKIASEEVSVVGLFKKLSKENLKDIAKQIASGARIWADSETEDSFDVIDSEKLQEDFYKQMSRNDIIEYVQDYLDGVTEEMLNNVSKHDIEQLKELLENISLKEVEKVMDNACDNSYENKEENKDGDNSPYGPGMDQKDFVK
jgi:hypothetical protein